MSYRLVVPDSVTRLAGSAQSMRFDCSWTERCAEGALLRLAGVLDFATVSQLARTLRGPALSARLIVLDLRELESIDLFGVHAIANASTSARKLGHRVVVLRAGADVDRMFKQAGRLDDVEIRDLELGEPAVRVLARIAENVSLA